MPNITSGRSELRLAGFFNTLNRLIMSLFSVTSLAVVADGTSNGFFKTTNTTTYKIAGINYTKAATDDLWDLSGETAVAAGKERAYWLYLDAAGAASFAAGGEHTAGEGFGLDHLPVPDVTKSVIATFVAGTGTDFTAALTAQGVLTQGVADDALGVMELGFLVETPL